LNTLKQWLRSLDYALASASSRLLSKFTDFTPEEPPPHIRQKLLIDCSYLYSTHINTGIQRVVRNIVRHIEPYAIRNGLELHTVALVNGRFVELDRHAIEHFEKLPTWRAAARRVLRKLRLFTLSFLSPEKIYRGDIVLLLDSSWYLPIWPSLEYAKKRGAHLVAVSYDLIPLSHPRFCDDRLQSVFGEWYERSLQYVDGYLAISKSVMDELENYLKENGVDLQRYGFDHFTLGSDFGDRQHDTQKVREELDTLYSTLHSPYLTVSTIEPRKNHRYIFESFKRLWEEGVDVSWVIVGKAGWKTEVLLDEIRNHSMYGKKLFLFNDLDDNELAYAYGHSKALIFASIVEGYGLPIIESLANGLPVLASDTPVHREVGGAQLHYFDIADPTALVSLVESIEKGNTKLANINPSTISIPNWEESARELLEKTLIITQQKRKGGP